MGHVVNPTAWRLNFTKYWTNLHSEKKDSNYLNFSDYIFLISLKRLLTKRIFYRYKLVFDRLTFIHRYWQDLLLLKFKYSKYSRKSNKKTNTRLGFLRRIKNHKKN